MGPGVGGRCGRLRDATLERAGGSRSSAGPDAGVDQSAGCALGSHSPVAPRGGDSCAVVDGDNVSGVLRRGLALAHHRPGKIVGHSHRPGCGDGRGSEGDGCTCCGRTGARVDRPLRVGHLHGGDDRESRRRPAVAYLGCFWRTGNEELTCPASSPFYSIRSGFHTANTHITLVECGFISDLNRSDWHWKVAARSATGGWGPYSPPMTFHLLTVSAVRRTPLQRLTGWSGCSVHSPSSRRQPLLLLAVAVSRHAAATAVRWMRPRR